MTQRQIQKMETKKNIYNAAMKLFSEKPFEDVKVSEIAEAANVSVGLIYFHFDSKDSIIDYGYSIFDDWLKNYVSESKVEDGFEKVHLLLKGQIDTVLELGHHLTTVVFKNQMEKKNTYLFSEDRYLYSEIRRNIELIKPGFGKEVTDSLLRISRGVIYDWCTRNGNYDLMAVEKKSLAMVYQYYHLDV